VNLLRGLAGRLLVLAALAGCAAPAAPASPAVRAGASPVSVAVASSDFEIGAPRVPFILFSAGQPIADAQSIQVTAFDLRTDPPAPGWSGAAVAYSDYAVPYWVVYPQLPSAGEWGFVADITLADGAHTAPEFVIAVAEQTSAPSLGETPPASYNRTLASEPNIARLTSDPHPEPGLYRLTVAEALTSGKPTVVTFATPGFCQTRLCAPVVDSVKAVYYDLQAAVNFIHIDVYQSFDPLIYATEMDEWQLPSEPWTFVLDEDGRVAARLSGPVSPRELSDVLAPLLAP
jgi:hypothetical protein